MHVLRGVFGCEGCFPALSATLQQSGQLSVDEQHLWAVCEGISNQTNIAAQFYLIYVSSWFDKRKLKFNWCMVFYFYVEYWVVGVKMFPSTFCEFILFIY